MKSVSFNRNNAKGFSLIELLLVLGVLAILLVAAFVVYPQVRDRNQANTEVSNLTSTKANINNLYASKGGNYTGLTTDIANQARVFPASMNNNTFDAGQEITTAWGGGVQLGVTNSPAGGANRAFTVTYATVPQGVCLGLVSGAAGNFADITVGGTSVYTGGQFDPGLAAANCNTADGGPVVFTSL